MSTRGLIGFVHNGEVRAKYNHYDSYLEKLGQGIADFCNTLSVEDWDSFIEAYDKIDWGEKEVTDSLETYQGADILPVILEGRAVTLFDEIEFAKDDIFCEYAYLLNLDSKELEIYSHNFKTEVDQTKALLPMNLLASYPFNEIPNHWIEFLNMRKKQVDMNWKDKLRGQGIEPDEIEL